MGFAETLSQAYSNLDKKLGGVLPGGVQPGYKEEKKNGYPATYSSTISGKGTVMTSSPMPSNVVIPRVNSTSPVTNPIPSIPTTYPAGEGPKVNIPTTLPTTRTEPPPTSPYNYRLDYTPPPTPPNPLFGIGPYLAGIHLDKNLKPNVQEQFLKDVYAGKNIPPINVHQGEFPGSDYLATAAAYGTIPFTERFTQETKEALSKSIIPGKLGKSVNIPSWGAQYQRVIEGETQAAYSPYAETLSTELTKVSKEVTTAVQKQEVLAREIEKLNKDYETNGPQLGKEGYDIYLKNYNQKVNEFNKLEPIIKGGQYKFDLLSNRPEMKFFSSLSPSMAEDLAKANLPYGTKLAATAAVGATNILTLASPLKYVIGPSMVVKGLETAYKGNPVGFLQAGGGFLIGGGGKLLGSLGSGTGKVTAAGSFMSRPAGQLIQKGIGAGLGGAYAIGGGLGVYSQTKDIGMSLAYAGGTLGGSYIGFNFIPKMNQEVLLQAKIRKPQISMAGLDKGRSFVKQGTGTLSKDIFINQRGKNTMVLGMDIPKEKVAYETTSAGRITVALPYWKYKLMNVEGKLVDTLKLSQNLKWTPRADYYGLPRGGYAVSGFGVGRAETMLRNTKLSAAELNLNLKAQGRTGLNVKVITPKQAVAQRSFVLDKLKSQGWKMNKAVEALRYTPAKDIITTIQGSGRREIGTVMGDESGKGWDTTFFTGKETKTYVQKPTSYVNPLTGVRAGIMTKGNIQFPKMTGAKYVINDFSGTKIGSGAPSIYTTVKVKDVSQKITDSQTWLENLNWKQKSKLSPELVGRITKGYGPTFWQSNQYRINPRTGKIETFQVFKELTQTGKIVTSTHIASARYDKWGNLKQVLATKKYWTVEGLKDGRVNTRTNIPQPRYAGEQVEKERGTFTKIMSSKQSSLDVKTSSYTKKKGWVDVENKGGVISVDKSTQTAQGPFTKIRETVYENFGIKNKNVYRMGKQDIWTISKVNALKDETAPLILVGGKVEVNFGEYTKAGTRNVLANPARGKIPFFVTADKGYLQELKTLQSAKGNVYSVSPSGEGIKLSLSGKKGSPFYIPEKPIFTFQKSPYTPLSKTFGSSPPSPPSPPSSGFGLFTDKRGSAMVVPKIDLMNVLKVQNIPTPSLIVKQSPSVKTDLFIGTVQPPIVSPVIAPTVRNVLSPTLSPVLSPTLSPVLTPVLTPTLTPVLTPTLTPVLTPVLTPTLTPVLTPTLTPTLTPVITPTLTPVISPNVVPKPYTRPPVRPVIWGGYGSKKEEKKFKKKITPGKKGFYVLTMKNKKPFLITPKPLIKEQALSFGVKYTKGTERATFKLVPTTSPATKIKIKPMTEQEVWGAGYRPPVKGSKFQKGKDIFIQRTATRMGRVKEYKAIQSYKAGRKSLW